jgi:putative ABC transport system permease protein
VSDSSAVPDRDTSLSRWRDYVAARLPPLGVAAERELEIVEELAQQLEAAHAAALARGADEAAATAIAAAEVPDWRALATELARIERRSPRARSGRPSNPSHSPGADPSRGGLMSGWSRDLRYALRSLQRAPGFASFAVATIAMGIAATTIVYSLVDGVLLRPFPIADPDRLTVLSSTDPDGNRMSLSWPDYLDLREQASSFSAIGAWAPERVNYVGGDRPELLPARRVTAGLFELLGVRPERGRLFLESDDAPGAEPVAVVSHRFWVGRLGGDPAAVGRAIRLGDHPVTVVGVLPASFSINRREDVFQPLGPLLAPGNYRLARENHWGLYAIARLRPGVELEAARTEVRALGQRLSAAHQDTSAGQGAELLTLRDSVVGQVRSLLWIVLAAVGALLAIGCVNLANLLIARATAQRQENAVRRALGAGRWRLVRQSLTETLILSGVGCALGTAVGGAGLRVLLPLLPEGFPRLEAVGLDLRVVGAAALVATATGLVVGVAAALLGSRTAVAPLLRDARVMSHGSGRKSTRRALLVTEIALAVVLVAGAGLMGRTLMRLLAVDPGFRPQGMLTAKLQLSRARHPRDETAAFLAAAEERLRALPGVEAAGFTQSLPIEGSAWGSVFVIEGRPELPPAEVPSLALVPVSPSYLPTLGVPIVAGRALSADDRADSPIVAVVSESFAERFFPNESPLGRRFKQGWTVGGGGDWIEIVGVAGDVKLDGLAVPATAIAYLPITQYPVNQCAVVLRVAGDPARFARQLEAALHELDPELPLFAVRPMRTLVDESLVSQRLSLWMLGGFSALALLLAAVGVFGVTAYLVAQRGREFGIRLALGADQAGVLRLVLGEGARTASAGVALGLAGAIAVAGVLRSLLYEVAPRDPATLAVAASALLVVSVGAALVPAIRAARIDPLAVLRDE